MSATQAAIAAGFTEQTANARSYLWIGENREDSLYPELWDYVQELRAPAIEKAEKEAGITLDEVMKSLTEIFKTNLTDIMDIEGFGIVTVKPMAEWPEYAKTAVQEMSFQKGKGLRVKLYSKMEAIEKLLKIFGAYEKDNAQKVGQDLATRLNIRNLPEKDQIDFLRMLNKMEENEE